MKIYIAGKIAGDENYREKFAAAAARLEEAGMTVLNPAVLPGDLTKADYMRICFAMIDSADAVYFLRDRAQSEGAKLEMQWCRYTGKPVADLARVLAEAECFPERESEG